MTATPNSIAPHATDDAALWPARLTKIAGPILRIGGPPAAATDSLARVREELDVIDRFRAAVRITAVPRTRSLTVSVTSTNPAKAALIANALADLYIAGQLDAKMAATRRASAWLDERLAELKARVEQSEAAVVDYRAGQALGPGQGEDLTAQQIAELNSELISARASLAAAEARAAQVDRRVREGGLTAAARVLSSELILTLRTGLAALIRREAELSARYGPKHPRIKDIRAEIADQRAAVAQEVRKIIEGLRNDVAVARARAAALERSLAVLEDKSVALSQTAVHLHQLEREAAADRRIYENFLTRVRETREQENLQSADARILSLAVPPLKPTGPNRRKIIAIALILGFTIGLGGVVLAEALARSVRAGAELTEAFGRPVLATLPRLGRSSGRRQTMRLLNGLAGAPGRAVQDLSAGMMLATGAARPRVIAVTSSVHGEEAVAVALALAGSIGEGGARVLVADTDVDHPRLAGMLSQDRPGLEAVLDGSAEAGDAIATVPGTEIDVMALRRSTAMMTPERLADVIEPLRATYDVILLITPPVLTGSAAAIAGRIADALLYTVRWRRTPLDAVREGVARLATLDVSPTGFVLTGTDRLREARFSFARFGAGYGQLVSRGS